jgi:ABC-type Fe3+/spermidine/putrescine transport system ATPase subunit
VPALQDISMSVRPAASSVIVGPSGCGKTSL